MPHDLRACQCLCKSLKRLVCIRPWDSSLLTEAAAEATEASEATEAAEETAAGGARGLQHLHGRKLQGRTL